MSIYVTFLVEYLFQIKLDILLPWQQWICNRVMMILFQGTIHWEYAWPWFDLLVYVKGTSDRWILIYAFLYIFTCRPHLTVYHCQDTAYWIWPWVDLSSRCQLKENGAKWKTIWKGNGIIIVLGKNKISISQSLEKDMCIIIAHTKPYKFNIPFLQ